jgi:Asp-tRNA(Asn)/Glu-tRNA(Gln) amidotransferase A subunit family amidase
MNSADVPRPGPTAKDTLLVLGTARLREALIRREITVPELVAEALTAIERLDGTLNAFVTSCPDRAMTEARAAQARLEAGGTLPPLLGLPLAVKDAEPVAGLRFTAGSLVHRNRIATTDSLHVARLRAAGAIVLGKTNTPEFTLLGETRNRLCPDTTNPWDPSRTAGGSSGGSAAAVAAGMVPLATGSDTAGSITVPAAFCGLAGLKPSHRRIPVWPDGADWQPYSDVGPIARDVAGLSMMLAATSGPDPLDPVSQQVTADLARFAPDRRLRVAWAAGLADLPVDPACARAATDLSRMFADLGHQTFEAQPDIADPGPSHDLLGAHEEHKARGGLLSGQAAMLVDETRAILTLGRDLSPDRLARARATSAAIARDFRRFMAEIDLFILPATACPAFPLRQPPAMIGGRSVLADWPSYAPFNMLANISGLPVATLPVRLSDKGLPLGALIFANFGQDGLLLSALAEAERLRGAFPFAPIITAR